MKLLITFAALSMCSAAVLSLLPEGTLRKTAMLVMGVLMVSIWADGIKDTFDHSIVSIAPETLLTNLSFTPSTSAMDVYQRSSGNGTQEDHLP